MTDLLTPPISAEFQLMAKPIGPRCNLRCRYCFYREKADLYGPDEKWRMTDEVLERYVREYLACLRDKDEVVFAWQGGEPTLMGVEFFRRALALQGKYARAGQRVLNAFQTNGMLLDDTWCAFLRDHNVLVGLSIDGPPEVHDPYRVSGDGHGTSARLAATMERLRRHRVQCNILCSVQRLNSRAPLDTYRYLCSLGAEFLQFIPIVVSDPSGPGGVSPESVEPEAWGTFLCEVFDAWIRRDVGKVFVQTFDMALAAWMGYPPPLCIHADVCGRALILEHNGDVYSCDHFVTEAHRLGNILEQPLAAIVDAPAQVRFALAKRDRRPDACRACRWDFVCRGECPKNRLSAPPGQAEPLNYLCEGFKRFFAHADPYMRQMAQALKQNLPAATIMAQFADADRPHGRKRRRRR